MACLSLTARHDSHQIKYPDRMHLKTSGQGEHLIMRIIWDADTKNQPYVEWE